MEHSTTRGKIVYTTTQSGETVHFGREWFSLTRHEDGHNTLRAHCEIEAGVVADRSVIRDVIYTTDATYRPVECYTRLQSNGTHLGSGWMTFDSETATCDALSPAEGRLHQKRTLDKPALSLGAHPVSCDILHLPRFDHSRKDRIQHQPDLWMTSTEHDGCSSPSLSTIALDIEYIGPEEVTVPAGTFSTHHYRFLNPTMTGDHPAEDLWCTDDFTFVKIAVGGYMAAEFKLVSLEMDD